MKSLLLSTLLLFTGLSTCVAGDWGNNYQDALAQAKLKNKKVLLDFTGSDWCPYCIKLDQEVFTSSTFKSFADANYILVTVDFPRQKELPAEIKTQNQNLKTQFKAHGYPSLIVVDADGRELGRTTGYAPGSGPDAVIAKLTKINSSVK